MNTAHDFTKRLQDLLAREHGALADFLVALADFDRRRLWIELGYTSLFYFLHRELGLSKGAAFYRKTAAELVQRFPEVVEPLRDGRLCLTTVVELAKVITPENRAEVLPRFFQLSKQEAKEASAEIQPLGVPPLRDVVTSARPSVAVRLAEPRQPDLGQSVHPANQPRPEERAAPEPAVAPEPPRPGAPPPSDTVEPLTSELSRMHVTVTRGLLKKLEAARAALSHSHPGAGIAEVIEAGLDLLLERRDRRKGLVKKPRQAPRPSADPGHVPAHVRRAVWERDGGKCQWPLASGGICESAVRLELDHVIPRAAGGPSNVENCRILCARHNDLAARQFYGDAFMDQFTRGMRAGVASGRPSRCRRTPGRAPPATQPPRPAPP